MRMHFSCNPTASSLGSRFEAMEISSAGTLSPVYLIPDELKPMRLKPNFPSSAILSLEYEPMISSVPKYEISSDAQQFISKQKKSVDYRNDLITISDKISAFLKKANIEPKISISLFQDPEYTDWLESKIVITVKGEELAKTYAIYENLLDYSLKDIKRRTIEKVVVSIEKR